jgi:hypothetical protein
MPFIGGFALQLISGMSARYRAAASASCDEK